MAYENKHTPTEDCAVHYTSPQGESACRNRRLFIFSTVEANRNCLPYIRSRCLLDVRGRSNRLGGTPLLGVVLPNPRPDPKG